MKAGWEVSTLGDTCEMYQPKTISGKEMIADGAYPVFGANGIIGRYSQYNHEEPQLLITCRGATCGSVNISEPKSWITGNAMVVRPKDASIEMRFLEYLFRGGIDISKAITGAAQPQITRTNLAPLKISYPTSVGEQQRIVGILDEAFDGIATAKANAERNLQNARALFESHLQSVFTQRGEGWIEKRLDDICQRVSVGYVGPTSQYYCDETQGIPFLRSQNVRPGRLDFEGIRHITKEFHKQIKKSQLQAGDLLFVRVGANRGDCCSVPDGLGEINCANIVFARPTEGNALYLERYCQSSHGRSQLLEMTTGSAQGVINTSSVAELIVPLPPISEQKQIVERLNELEQETQRLESIYQQKLAALDELKQSLLHQAFTGQL